MRQQMPAYGKRDHNGEPANVHNHQATPCNPAQQLAAHLGSQEKIDSSAPHRWNESIHRLVKHLYSSSISSQFTKQTITFINEQVKFTSLPAFSHIQAEGRSLFKVKTQVQREHSIAKGQISIFPWHYHGMKGRSSSLVIALSSQIIDAGGALGIAEIKRKRSPDNKYKLHRRRVNQRKGYESLEDCCRFHGQAGSVNSKKLCRISTAPFSIGLTSSKRKGGGGGGRGGGVLK